MVRALDSQQCGLARFPDLAPYGCGLSLLLVLYSAPRGLSPGTPASPLLKNQHFQIAIRSGMHGYFKRVVVNSWCSVGKQITKITLHSVLKHSCTMSFNEEN